MADVLLIKNLNEDQLNSKSLIPVTFQTNISDKDKLVNIFNVLKDKKLVENKKLGIKKSSITLDLFSSNITEVIKELIKNEPELKKQFIEVVENEAANEENSWYPYDTCLNGNHE